MDWTARAPTPIAAACIYRPPTCTGRWRERRRNCRTTPPRKCIGRIQKFITLALKANPNILECLYTPLVETATPLGEELLAMRGCFLSKLVHQTYTHYVAAQFRRMQSALRSRGEVNWKHAMHLLRLLLSGITVLREGVVAVDVSQHRERLLAVRSGRIGWQEVDAWRLQLVAEFDSAFACTTLPAQPDYERADRFLICARRRAVEDRLP